MIFDTENSSNNQIIDELMKGESVPSGYGVDYTFSDIIQECNPLEDLLNNILSTRNDHDLLAVAKELRNQLAFAASQVAVEARESFK